MEVSAGQIWMGGLLEPNLARYRRSKMRGLKFGLVILAATMLTLAFGGLAYAFHSGGVAECGGCHSMHSPKAGGSFLLIASDASSTCLSCHQQTGLLTPSSFHISTAEADMPAGTAPRQRSPGGDFGWLKKTYSFVVRGTTTTEDGFTHGHNIIALDFGYVQDPSNTTSPGGTYPAAQLRCPSCHDMHGQYRRIDDNTVVKPSTTTPGTFPPIIASGSYATNTTPGYAEPPAPGTALGVFHLLKGNQDGFPGVPAAKDPATYNRSESTSFTRTAYGIKTGGGHTTWGLWCATCHATMHSSGNYVHPVDQNLGSQTSENYRRYIKSGDMGGDNINGFNSLAPFATPGTYGELAALAVNNNSVLTGPATTSQVTCPSCHRVHASGWEFMLRWNMEGEFMVYNSLYPGTDNGTPVQFARGRSAAETQAAYYDRPVTQFASYQRVYCNKCHAKD